ncbi:MAG: D-alanyl-D-alanine carboxypeptidase [Parvibaculaceae bacterium]|nr:D-alanyl-D-alanine carboxypeptidase [Parvibaculaceae bacterium]
MSKIFKQKPKTRSQNRVSQNRVDLTLVHQNRANTQSERTGKRRSGGNFLALFALTAMVLVSSLTVTPAQANPKYAALVMDAHTGKILHSRNADLARYPASLTKIMTLYMLFDALEHRKVSLSTRMRTSRRATHQAPSRLGLKRGETIRVDEAIKALVTKSANDVATVVAEHLAGTESAFARKMTRRARELGMTRTRFMNASGLPNRRQRTTARDMSKLGLAIRADFPDLYQYFATKSFRWKGRKYKNHNNLLGKYDGTIGIKTGYTRASGFNLVAAIERNNRYVIAVVLGGKKAKSRDRQMVSLLDQHLHRAIARAPGGTRLANAPKPMKRPESLMAAPTVAMLAAAEMGRETPSIAAVPAMVTNNIPLASPVTKPIADSPLTAQAFYALAQARAATSKMGELIISPAHAALPLEERGGSTLPNRNQQIQPRSTKTSEDPLTTGSISTASRQLPTSTSQSSVDLANAAPATRLRLAPTKRKTGPLFSQNSWVIQIGAYTDASQAVDSIRAAMAAAPTELRSAVPITVPVLTDEMTLYRSRFGGFETETTARKACGRLARANLSCIAIPPSGWAAPKYASVD